MPNFLIIGQGDIGLPVTNTLAKNGRSVTGLARGERTQYDLHQHAKFMQADALDLTVDDLNTFSHIAIIVTPDEYTSNAYNNTYFAIARHLADMANNLPKLERLVFISSTGVYGQDDGEWVDVFTKPLSPKREASGFILNAERVLQSAFTHCTVIIRPSGIYGKNRLMRIRKAQEANEVPMPAKQWTNRIMDTDLVNIIVQVLTSDDVQPLYLASDFAPVTSSELTNWLCQQLNEQSPTLDDKLPTSGKRIHSNVPASWLKYPDWQVGYQHVLKTL